MAAAAVVVLLLLLLLLLFASAAAASAAAAAATALLLIQLGVFFPPSKFLAKMLYRTHRQVLGTNILTIILEKMYVVTPRCAAAVVSAVVLRRKNKRTRTPCCTAD